MIGLILALAVFALLALALWFVRILTLLDELSDASSR